MLTELYTLCGVIGRPLGACGLVPSPSRKETTAVVGAAYDFSHIITDGLKFQTRYGKGWNVIDASTGAAQSRQSEFNFEVEYLPMSGPFENLHVHLFCSGVRFPDNPPGQESQPQWHGVFTYLVPLL